MVNILFENKTLMQMSRNHSFYEDKYRRSLANELEAAEATTDLLHKLCLHAKSCGHFA